MKDILNPTMLINRLLIIALTLGVAGCSSGKPSQNNEDKTEDTTFSEIEFSEEDEVVEIEDNEETGGF